MCKRTSYSFAICAQAHELFISHRAQAHKLYCFYIVRRAMVTATTQRKQQHHMSVSSPSCAGAQASFCTVCCCLTTTTHDYASNKPSCASAWALHLACRHQDNTSINYDKMTIQPTTSLCMSAWANSHHAQSHELYSASLQWLKQQQQRVDDKALGAC